MSGLLSQYLGEGVAADRPATPAVQAGSIALWYSTDTMELSLWDGSAWIEDIGGVSAAEDVTYDNATSGLTATDVQAAIDEIAAGGGGSGDVVGPASAVDDRIATFDGVTGKLIQDSGTLISALATLASPTFTGTPAAPTAAGGTNTTQIATTAFVTAAVAAVTPGMVKLGTATVAGSAATVLTLSGLNLSAYTSFFVVVQLDNATGSGSSISLYYNADTTATNYYEQSVVWNNTVGTAARANDARIGNLDASETLTGSFEIIKDRDGKPRANVTMSRAQTSSIFLQHFAHAWNSATNVTGITLSSSVANALAVGSTFTVYGRTL